MHTVERDVAISTVQRGMRVHVPRNRQRYVREAIEGVEEGSEERQGERM